MVCSDRGGGCKFFNSEVAALCFADYLNDIVNKGIKIQSKHIENALNQDKVRGHEIVDSMRCKLLMENFEATHLDNKSSILKLR